MSLLDAYGYARVMLVHQQQSPMAVRKKTISTNEIAVMQELRSAGCTYRQIAAKTGRTYNGVRCALDPAAREQARLVTAKRRAEAKADNPEAFYKKERAQQHAYHRRRPELKMLYSSRESAKRQGLPFNLDESDIQIPDQCPVLGIEIERANGSRNYNSPSIDRLVPKLGYVKGNVQVISWRANKLKGEGTATEHQQIAEWMIRNGAI